MTKGFITEQSILRCSAFLYVATHWINIDFIRSPTGRASYLLRATAVICTNRQLAFGSSFKVASSGCRNAPVSNACWLDLVFLTLKIFSTWSRLLKLERVALKGSSNLRWLFSVGSLAALHPPGHLWQLLCCLSKLVCLMDQLCHFVVFFLFMG